MELCSLPKYNRIYQAEADKHEGLPLAPREKEKGLSILIKVLFEQGAAKGAVKWITKWFEDKKKKDTDAAGAEKDEATKQKFQESISVYNSILAEAGEAAKRLAEKFAKKKE